MEIEIVKRNLNRDMHEAIGARWSSDMEVLEAIAENFPDTTFYRREGGKRVCYTAAEIIIARDKQIEVR